MMKDMKQNFKKSTSQFDSPELQRYLQVWILRALREQPRNFEQLTACEGLRNQGYAYISKALQTLISDCVVVGEWDGSPFRLAVDTDVSATATS
jgi:hypothetical protein